MRSIERRSRIKKSDLVDFRTTLTQIDGPGKGSHVSVPISKQHKFQLAKHFPEFYFYFFWRGSVFLQVSNQWGNIKLLLSWSFSCRHRKGKKLRKFGFE